MTHDALRGVCAWPPGAMPFDDGLAHKTFAADFTHYPWTSNAEGVIEWLEDEQVTLPLVRRYVVCSLVSAVVERASFGMNATGVLRWVVSRRKA